MKNFVVFTFHAPLKRKGKDNINGEKSFKCCSRHNYEAHFTDHLHSGVQRGVQLLLQCDVEGAQAGDPTLLPQ